MFAHWFQDIDANRGQIIDVESCLRWPVKVHAAVRCWVTQLYVHLTWSMSWTHTDILQ